MTMNDKWKWLLLAPEAKFFEISSAKSTYKEANPTFKRLMWLWIILHIMSVGPPRIGHFHPSPPRSVRSPHFFSDNYGPPRKYGILKNQVPPESWGGDETMIRL